MASRRRLILDGRKPAAAALRVFLALVPDPASRVRLDLLAESLLATARGARRVARENFHLTLAFIGPLSADRARSLAGTLAGVEVAPFDWELDHTGVFERARVAWAGGRSCQAVRDLAQRARSILREMEVAFDTKPFEPHVTLLRNVVSAGAGLARPIEPSIPWRCERPLLLSSVSGPEGVRYSVVEPASTGPTPAWTALSPPASDD
jgi:2'-5' RNA ligase